MAGGNSTLVVEVTSSRRHYGQLIAHYPGAVEFFPQDREMLGLYAKHAAAVLDTAMALQESAQRHRQVNLLLSLSEALAEDGHERGGCQAPSRSDPQGGRLRSDGRVDVG